jgi:hypothetical protein
MTELLMTADGEKYRPSFDYHFYDPVTERVRYTVGLKLYDGHLCDVLGTMAQQVILVSKLRRSRA